MMNIPVVLATAAEAPGWGERASTAGTVTLMGMVTIFAVLAILWAMIEIMHAVLHKGEKKEKAPRPKKAEPVAATPANDDAAIAAAIAAALAAAEDDGAIVAAITAAITAARAEAGETGAFRVVSFKRAERTRGWRR